MCYNYTAVVNKLTGFFGLREERIMSRTPTISSRERLLQAARILFAERGYEATTTAAIAQRARTSQSQLLNHFKDKPGLLAAILEQGWSELNKAVRLAIGRMASLSDQLKLIIDMLLSYLEEDRNFRALFLLETDRRDVLDRGAGDFAEILDGILGRMSAGGQVTSDMATRARRAALLWPLK